MKILKMYKEIWNIFTTYSKTKTFIFVIMLILFSMISFIQPILSGQIILLIQNKNFFIFPAILFTINIIIPKITTIISSYNSDLLAGIVQSNMKLDLLSCMIYTKNWAEGKSKGEIITSINSDTSIILNIGKLMLSFSANVLSAIIAAIGLLIYNKAIFIFSTIVAVAIYFVNYYFNKKISIYSQKKYELSSSYKDMINNLVYSYEEMKFQIPFSKAIDNMKSLQKSKIKNEIECDAHIESPGRILDLITGITPAISYSIGILFFHSDYKQLSLIIVTTSYMINYWSKISFISFIRVLSNPLIDSLSRINQLLNAYEVNNTNEIDIEESYNVESIKKIEIKNLTFSYDNKNYLFMNYSIQFPASGFITLQGASGCGKSTLLKLILKENITEGGDIYINDIRLSDILLQKWKKIVGYMPQSGHLFSGTIRENIALFNPEFDEDFVIQYACKLNLIKELGIDFMNYSITEGDVGLSVGQKDRIRFLCLLAKQPNLLLLDEPSSSLDNENTKIIIDILIQLKTDVLIICSTHNPFVIESSDFTINIERSCH